MLKMTFCLVALTVAGTANAAATVDLSGTVIVTPRELDRREQKAVAVLVEEIQKRTGVTLEQSANWPTNGKPVIAIGRMSKLAQFAGPYSSELEKMLIPGPEGFLLVAKQQPRGAVLIAANDARGLLFGVGRLLRKMDLAPKTARVPAELNVVTAPKYPIRGHQLGYRPKVNAYDAWTDAQFDQYIRELALFGANSIEILPPRTDDERTSRHMKLPPLEMMIRLSKIIDSYGLDVWIWYPNMGKDYVGDAAVRTELAEREEIFQKLPRIDHVFVPGGDPGDLAPELMYPWLAKMSVPLQKYHPRAKIWVSPQGMFAVDKPRLEAFIRLANEKPAWLGGMVHGPWIPLSLPQLRAALAPEIPLRNYPDITHNVVCQYPVPNWDLALALTNHRESFNPRPQAMKIIHNRFAESASGSLCYSEGINDDVNKFVWLDQDWDPSMPVAETLRDFAGLFIDSQHRDGIAQGLLAEEKNWEGPLAVNAQVETTLQQWQALEKSVPATTRDNYRFQMGLLRAYYDAYVRQRLLHETNLETTAREVLKTESVQGAFAAMQKAESILAKSRFEPVATELKQTCETLADSLFDKIGWQPSVDKHGALHRSRGAVLDNIDEPLNNVAWFRAQFRLVRELNDEPARLAAIERMLSRTDPGPGGFYDNLGSPSSESRVVNTVAWEDDPGTLRSPRTDFPYILTQPQHRDAPLAWRMQKLSLYSTPLTIAYDNLDPAAAYTVRVTYAGEFNRPSSLAANGSTVIHQKVDKQPSHEFPIPREATAQGRLELTWHGGGVSEVWLLRQPINASPQ